MTEKDRVYHCPACGERLWKTWDAVTDPSGGVDYLRVWLTCRHCDIKAMGQGYTPYSDRIDAEDSEGALIEAHADALERLARAAAERK